MFVRLGRVGSFELLWGGGGGVVGGFGFLRLGVKGKESVCVSAFMLIEITYVGTDWARVRLAHPGLRGRYFLEPQAWNPIDSSIHVYIQSSHDFASRYGVTRPRWMSSNTGPHCAYGMRQHGLGTSEPRV